MRWPVPIGALVAGCGLAALVYQAGAVPLPLPQSSSGTPALGSLAPSHSVAAQDAPQRSPLRPVDVTQQLFVAVELAPAAAGHALHISTGQAVVRSHTPFAVLTGRAAAAPPSLAVTPAPSDPGTVVPPPADPVPVLPLPVPIDPVPIPDPVTLPPVDTTGGTGTVPDPGTGTVTDPGTGTPTDPATPTDPPTVTDPPPTDPTPTDPTVTDPTVTDPTTTAPTTTDPATLTTPPAA